MSDLPEEKPSLIQRMPLPFALLFGFLLLPFGVALLPIAPEFGVPLLYLCGAARWPGKPGGVDDSTPYRTDRRLINLPRTQR